MPRWIEEQKRNGKLYTIKATFDTAEMLMKICSQSH